MAKGYLKGFFINQHIGKGFSRPPSKVVNKDDMALAKEMIHELGPEYEDQFDQLAPEKKELAIQVMINNGILREYFIVQKMKAQLEKLDDPDQIQKIKQEGLGQLLSVTLEGVFLLKFDRKS
jgi:hypothetical protein